MRLIDDEYVDPNEKVTPDVTAVNIETLKEFIRTQTRKAGGALDLEDLMKEVRDPETGKKGWWRCVHNQMWHDAAEAVQSEWSAKRAAKVPVLEAVKAPKGTV
jgi:hypothetical protein